MRILAKMFDVPRWKFDIFVAIVMFTLFMNFVLLLVIPEHQDGIEYITEEVFRWFVCIFLVSLPFFCEFVLDSLLGFLVPN